MNEEEILEQTPKYYYKRDEQGNIKQCLYLQNPSDEIKAEYIETEREITVAPNGRLMFADEVADMDFSIPLEEIKVNKIAQLKDSRDTEEQSPILYNGYYWDFDDKAIQRINGAIIALSGGGTITWTSANNEEIRSVNADDLRGVISASAVRSNELHVKYRQLREQVEQATTLEEVEEIVW